MSVTLFGTSPVRSSLRPSDNNEVFAVTGETEAGGGQRMTTISASSSRASSQSPKLGDNYDCPPPYPMVAPGNPEYAGGYRSPPPPPPAHLDIEMQGGGMKSPVSSPPPRL